MVNQHLPNRLFVFISSKIELILKTKVRISVVFFIFILCVFDIDFETLKPLILRTYSSFEFESTAWHFLAILSNLLRKRLQLNSFYLFEPILK